MEEDELERLALECLAEQDPDAALERRTEGRPDLRASARRVLDYVRRTEQEIDQEAGSAATPVEPVTNGSAGEPSVIPGIALESVIGRGGQAIVFRGRQKYLDRPVAVKLMYAQHRESRFVRRFRREARTLASLTHPHIVTCHDAGVTEAGQCFLVMELIEGPTLRAWLSQHRRMPVAIALDVARAIAEALDDANKAGIVHRDVKPENVLLKPRADAAPGDPFPFVPKLADLGLARTAGLDTSGPLLTPQGMVIGTPATMAPEQIDSPDAIDHRADIYGLGCVLFHALAGRPAFEGKRIADLFAAKTAGKQPDLGALVQDVPRPVVALVHDMIARDPNARPSTYEALLARIDAARGVPVARAPRRARRILAGVGAAALAAIAAAFAWAKYGTNVTVADAAWRALPVDGSLLVPAADAMEDPMSGWERANPGAWFRDDTIEDGGALCNAGRGETWAARDLPPGDFALEAVVVPRGAWPRRVGVLLEFSDGVAFAAEIVAVREAATVAAGRRAAGTPIVTQPGARAIAGDTVPFTLRWTDDALAIDCNAVDPAVLLPATKAVGARPLRVRLEVEGGVVGFRRIALRRL